MKPLYDKIEQDLKQFGISAAAVIDQDNYIMISFNSREDMNLYKIVGKYTEADYMGLVLVIWK